jgi:WD40 repeat protein
LRWVSWLTGPFVCHSLRLLCASCVLRCIHSRYRLRRALRPPSALDLPSSPLASLSSRPSLLLSRSTGSDDFQLRIYNYNTHEKIAAFEAHPDYIRCLTVHPTLPLVLTGSDDMTIKCWDWEKGWKCVQVSLLALHAPSSGATD